MRPLPRSPTTMRALPPLRAHPCIVLAHARRPAHNALFSAVRRVERRLLEQLAAANLRRLLGFARSLQVGMLPGRAPVSCCLLAPWQSGLCVLSWQDGPSNPAACELPRWCMVSKWPGAASRKLFCEGVPVRCLLTLATVPAACRLL